MGWQAADCGGVAGARNNGVQADVRTGTADADVLSVLWAIANGKVLRLRLGALGLELLNFRALALGLARFHLAGLRALVLLNVRRGALSLGQGGHPAGQGES